LPALLKFAAPVVFLAFIFLCSRIPSLAEAYMQCCYPAVAAVLSFVSCRVPFSLLDFLIIAAIIAFTGSTVLMLTGRWPFRRWMQAVILFILWLAVWFYMAWGIGYFRPDFHVRFHVSRQTADKDFFEAFVIRHIDALNDSYVADQEFDVREVDSAVEKMYGQYCRKMHLPYPCGKRRTKYTMLEGMMTRMGVSGFFDPFFNEVQVNNFLLPADYPFTLAHEKAHQFGIANEAECNLYASVVCTASDHPLVRYSGYLQTVSYLLGNFKKISPDQYRSVTGRIDPRVMADYRKIQDHWQKALNPRLSDIQDKVYDSYLKTNRQQSGIRSYSEMVQLLFAWEQIKDRPVD
jgi:hypothetical protein